MQYTYRLSKLLLTLSLMLGLIAPLGPARAQGSVSLASLTIRVWPEYDQSAALVFYVGKAAEGTTLPAELRFQMPPGAVLNATAYVEDQTGSLLTVPSKVEGNIVTITSPNGSFHVEFYDPELKVEGDQRSYSLVWQGDYSVDLLTVEVLQPVGARNMTIEPAGGSWTADSQNLQTYAAGQGGVQAGQQIPISISYAKSDNTLTVDALAPASPGGAAQSTSAPFTISWQMIGLSVLIVALLAGIGGAVYYFRRRQGAVQASAGTGRRFCTSCGHAAGAEDRFCRNCGARLG